MSNMGPIIIIAGLAVIGLLLLIVPLVSAFKRTRFRQQERSRP